MTHRFNRGDYFRAHNLENIEGVVVLKRGNIGYDGYMVAEKDTAEGKWFSYWTKDSHFHDEVDNGVIEQAGTIPETADDPDTASLEGVETAVTQDGGVTPDTAKRVDEV